MNNHKQPILLSGNSNKPLATAVANILKIPLGNTISKKFSDGEVNLKIAENLDQKDVIIFQSTCPPVNDHLLELLLMANAVNNAKGSTITAIIPYFGYARQNSIILRSSKSFIEPNSAQITAKLLETTGIHKIITLDLHTEKIIQYFQIPCINVLPTDLILTDLKSKQVNDLSIVVPDLGSLLRAQMIISRFKNAEFAIIYKNRSLTNNITNTKITGKIKNRNCVLIDDIVDTAITVCTAAETLKLLGAKQITAYCTHPVLSGKAIRNIKDSQLTEVIVTDTIQLPLTATKCNKIRQISVTSLIAAVIKKGAALDN